LFVSHNLKLVESLCSTGMVLDQGTAIFHGTSGNALKHYLRENEEGGAAMVIKKDGPISFKKLIDRDALQTLSIDSDLVLRMKFNTTEPVYNFHCDIAVRNKEGVTVVHTRSTWN
ncbi:MAG: hypothetical protein KDC56_05465, partial [Flavobacteriaceae bacterium]|nr:hypothetical protein [Flavobacteriaceae bacterium]